MTRPPPRPVSSQPFFDATSLPPEVAVEIASCLRSSLFAPLATNITTLRDTCEATISSQEDMLQDAQSHISNVIEPVSAQLVPIAAELQDVYRQIDLLEGLIFRVNDNIKMMTSKLERTEQILRREERALDEGRPLEVWKEPEKVQVFRAADYVDGGVLKERPGNAVRDNHREPKP